jgi:hypothetical protein
MRSGLRHGRVQYCHRCRGELKELRRHTVRRTVALYVLYGEVELARRVETVNIFCCVTGKAGFSTQMLDVQQRACGFPKDTIRMVAR